MSLRKIILSTSCLVLLSAPASAGWDQQSFDNQTRAKMSIQKQLERLERENEQLRNAIAQMRQNGIATAKPSKKPSSDVRVQALVEENKRLLRQLDQYKGGNIDKLSVNKIYSLNQDNDRLKVQIKAIEEKNRFLQRQNKKLESNPTVTAQIDTTKLEAKIAGLEKQNATLTAQNTNLGKIDVSKYDKQIKQLETENAKLKEQENVTSNLSQKNITDLKAQITSLEKRNAEFKSQGNGKLAQAQQSIADMESKLKELEQKNEVLKAEKASYVSNVSNSNSNVRALEDKIVELRAENKKIKSKSTEAQNIEVSKFETQIKKLEQENLTLKNNNDGATKQTQKTLASLKTQIKTLEDQNKALQAENKSFELSSKQSDGQIKATLAKKEQNIASLKSEITALKQKNTDITSQLAQVNKSVATKGSSDDVYALKTQNSSLRETIKAQTQIMKRNDNAIQRAETLTSENIRLKKQLEMANSAKYSNDETAQNLIKKNQELIEELNIQKQQVANLEGLKETVRQLRLQNDNYAAKLKGNDELSNEITAMRQKNKGLQAELKKEKGNASSYRAEIAKYQKEGVLQTTSNSASSNENADEALTALRLENQELKARIELLASKSAKTSVVFKKEDMKARSPSETLLNTNTEESAVRYIKEETEVIAKGVKMVETSYPKVDKVKPILNHQGNHIYEAVKPEVVEVEEMGQEGLKAEDLLRQELKPLSK